jgi:calnexin
MIDNPEYKGKWAPRKIENPEFFDDATPYKMMTIGSIGFELWTLSNDFYFDNILITDSGKTAKYIAEKVFYKGMTEYGNCMKDKKNTC